MKKDDPDIQFQREGKFLNQPLLLCVDVLIDMISFKRSMKIIHT